MVEGAGTQYTVYKNDRAKAKAYAIRLAAADDQFKDYSELAEGWWDRYETVQLQTQQTPKGHRVQVTTGLSVIDSLFSGLTALDVEYVIEALGKATPQQATIAEVALNQEWLQTHADQERDSAIKDALIVGIGFVKVAYDYVSTMEKVERPLEDIEAEVVHLLDEARTAGVEAPDPNVIAQLVPDFEDRENVHRDRIVVDYVPWTDIRWDPAAKRWKDVRWVAQYTRMPVEEVRSNPLWQAYSKQRGTSQKLRDVPADTVNGRQLNVKLSEYDKREERCTVVEFHDLVTGTVCTLVKGQDWLLNESVNPYALHPDYPDRSAFVPLVLRATNRQVRGIGDVEVMLTSLREKDLYRSKTAEYIDKFVPKVIGPEDALTVEGQAALEGNQYGAYVSTSGQYDASAITDLKPPTLPEELFGMNDRLDNEIREATGVNELMRGLFPDRKRTATETSEVVSASAARQSEKRNTLEQFHIEIARRILHLMQQFYDKDRVVRFLDPNIGDVAWDWNADDIMGEYDLNVHLSPRSDHSRETLKQEALDFMSVFGPFAQPGSDGASTLDPSQMVMWAMKRFGLSRRDILELTNKPEDQQLQQTDQLANQAQQAQAAQGVPPAQMPQSPVGVNPAANVIPQDVLAAAVGGIGPGAPESAGQVSSSRGTG